MTSRSIFIKRLVYLILVFFVPTGFVLDKLKIIDVEALDWIFWWFFLIVIVQMIENKRLKKQLQEKVRSSTR